MIINLTIKTDDKQIVCQKIKPWVSVLSKLYLTVQGQILPSLDCSHLRPEFDTYFASDRHENNILN